MALSYSVPQGTTCIIESANAVAAGVVFSFQPTGQGDEFSVMFTASGGATYASDLQTTTDQGATWVNYVATAFTAINSIKVVPSSGTTPTPMVAGQLFRFNHTTLTGGPVVIRATSN